MKTSILKWDVRIQVILLILTAAVLLEVIFTGIIHGWASAGYGALAIIYIQLIFAPLQIAGNAIHLGLKHKSIGYRTRRLVYLFAYPVYIGLLLCFHDWLSRNTSGAVLELLWLVIPVTISCTYFLFCRSELRFLQNREFFILH